MKTYPRKAKNNISGGWYGSSLGKLVLNTACTVSASREGKRFFSYTLYSPVHLHKTLIRFKLHDNVNSLENKFNRTWIYSIQLSLRGRWTFKLSCENEIILRPELCHTSGGVMSCMWIHQFLPCSLLQTERRRYVSEPQTAAKKHGQ